MRKMWFAAAALLGALSAVAVPAGPAQAIGGEWLGCYVSPTQYWEPFTQDCGAGVYSFNYDIIFRVLNGSGSYNYAWTITGGSPSSGCSSASNTCVVSVDGRYDHFVQASVVISQGGQSAQLYTWAATPATCPGIGGSGPMPC